METDVEKPESGSAILVFTFPPDYSTVHGSLYLPLHLDISGVLATFLFVCLCRQKGFRTVCILLNVHGCMLSFLKRRQMEISTVTIQNKKWITILMRKVRIAQPEKEEGNDEDWMIVNVLEF